MKTDRNIAGMATLFLGIMIYSVQDAIIKAISGDYPITEAIVIRSMVALPLLTLLVAWESGLGRLRSGRAGALALRGTMLLLAYVCFYMSLPALPLAEAVALFFIAPVMVTILAGPVLGETVRPKAWLAVAAGFAGVLIILRPGSALFEPAALLSVVSAVTYATAMVMGRRLGISEPAGVMSFYQNGVLLTGAALIASLFGAAGVTALGHPSLDFLVRPWAIPTTRDFLMMASCGVVAAVAMSLLTQAYRLAEANLVTVFEYSGMIWGPLWGFLFFGEVPRWSTYAGMALIVASGVFAVRSAQRRSVDRAPA